MRPRLRLGRCLLRLGAFVQSLPVAVMRPDDLVEFSRQSYAKQDSVEAWGSDTIVDSGLSDSERDLLGAVPAAGRRNLLLLGLGGGREAVALGQMGFRVTGVDYVKAMVDRAKENAARRGIDLGGLVQEISQVDVAPCAYDVVWLARCMYSCVPTRARRVGMVERVARALRPGGLFLCQFHWHAATQDSARGTSLRRVVATLAGNVAYEPGDVLWQNVEFVHGFSSEDTIASELADGGLRVLRIDVDTAGMIGSAVCSREPGTGSQVTQQRQN